VSPSPSKRRPISRGAPQDDDDTEEDDEETLQLKLQAIEARLKLKALQRAKKAAEGGDKGGNTTSSQLPAAASTRRVEIPRPPPDIEVPHSPVRKQRLPQEQRSPARVILGIDKGLRAQDVSLKRPGGGRMSRTDSARSETPKAKSFSERIAEGRNREKQREEKEVKAEEKRSRGFGLHSIDGLKERPALSRTGSSLSSGSQEMPPPTARGLSNVQTQSNALRNPPTPRPVSNLSSRGESSRPPSSASTPSSSGFGVSKTAAKYEEIALRDNSTEAASFESYSGLHLKSRSMEHNVVTRTLDGKTIFTLPQLLKTVKAPEYDPPDWENDYVIIGVICHKSTPHSTKNAARDQTKGNQERGTDQQGKYMVITLTDLKHEISLFLFDTGFSQFWKLPLGTLVAVLNPDIMPPRDRGSGKFSLKLSSSDDTILELGTARDLDFCHANKKDGKNCETWIDSRKTEFCDFHVQLQVEKTKRGRMEINTMVGMGKGPAGGGKFGMFGGRGGGAKGDSLKREGKYHDRELHETVYIAPRPGGATTLIDRDEQSWERGASREERFRKQLADKEKERELAKKLGQMGEGSTGGDYLKLKGSDTPNLPARGSMFPGSSSMLRPELSKETDFRSLLNRKADDVSLASSKRKRIASGKSSASNNNPIGWGIANKRGLLSPTKDTTSALRGAREPSPAKKKARLLLPDKGIREPGRESLGGLDVGLIAAMDEDDDDLEVI
jgi:minichromosome maintenance protein 10